MKEDAFRSWLSHIRGYGRGTVGSRVSNCRTVEQWEANLDQQFDQDRLCDLIDRLTYSTEDQRRKRPARHKIPIDGDVRTGSGTLKSAVSLYKQFRENWVEETPILPPSSNRTAARTTTRAAKVKERREWPAWEQPSPEGILAMAHLAVPFVRILNPDIVRAVVEDNELHRTDWIEVLQERQIDPAAYLWEGSPCAFPGVRRYAGSREIAMHRGHTELNENQTLNALALDDNDSPKQIWSFVFRGAQFSKFGPGGHALAHLADHKDHGNRFEQEFEVAEDREGIRPLFGLYTCPSNTVYIPSSLIKPTDFVGTIRALLIRRAQQLYGSFCQMLPPFLRIPQTSSPEWDVSEFKWGDPVGTTQNIASFLKFRGDRMQKLIHSSGAA